MKIDGMEVMEDRMPGGLRLGDAGSIDVIMGRPSIPVSRFTAFHASHRQMNMVVLALFGETPPTPALFTTLESREQAEEIVRGLQKCIDGAWPKGGG